MLAWLPASSRPARWENRPLVVSLVGRPGGGGGGGPASLRAPARAEPAASPAKPKLPELKHKDETPPEKPKEKPKETEGRRRRRNRRAASGGVEGEDRRVDRAPARDRRARRSGPVRAQRFRRRRRARPRRRTAQAAGRAEARARAPAAAVPLQVSAGIDEPGFGYDYYLEALIGKISETWRPPAGLPSEAQGTNATLRFRLTAEGRVQQVDVEMPSTFPIFDRSALEAITRAQPFPPFPPGFAGRGLTVHMKFTFRE